jgi:hypothetical protein
VNIFLCVCATAPVTRCIIRGNKRKEREGIVISHIVTYCFAFVL